MQDDDNTRLHVFKSQVGCTCWKGMQRYYEFRV